MTAAYYINYNKQVQECVILEMAFALMRIGKSIFAARANSNSAAIRAAVV